MKKATQTPSPPSPRIEAAAPIIQNRPNTSLRTHNTSPLVGIIVENRVYNTFPPLASHASNQLSGLVRAKMIKAKK